MRDDVQHAAFVDDAEMRTTQLVWMDSEGGSGVSCVCSWQALAWH
jgi:hypothetical protein